ncbi:RNA polymerase sigma factor [Hellea sp.]|nr:RNA polymerase sigma factor [Hellea sp.]
MLGGDTFDDVVRAHQGGIRNFLRRLTRETALADDLAQICFMKAYEQRHRLRDAKAAKSWLFQIAYRSFVDHHRKEARRRGLAEGHIEDDTPQAQAGLKMDVEAAMNSLPSECRAVVILCLAHGMSHSEAAAATELPLGTVKSHVLRGKAKLRTFLSAYEKVD